MHQIHVSVEYTLVLPMYQIHVSVKIDQINQYNVQCNTYLFKSMNNDLYDEQVSSQQSPCREYICETSNCNNHQFELDGDYFPYCNLNFTCLNNNFNILYYKLFFQKGEIRTYEKTTDKLLKRLGKMQERIASLEKDIGGKEFIFAPPEFSKGTKSPDFLEDSPEVSEQEFEKWFKNNPFAPKTSPKRKREDGLKKDRSPPSSKKISV